MMPQEKSIKVKRKKRSAFFGNVLLIYDPEIGSLEVARAVTSEKTGHKKATKDKFIIDREALSLSTDAFLLLDEFWQDARKGFANLMAEATDPTFKKRRFPDDPESQEKPLGTRRRRAKGTGGTKGRATAKHAPDAATGVPKKRGRPKGSKNKLKV